MSIEQALGRLHELSARETMALAGLKQLSEEINDTRKTIAELILAGESTGDPISDYVHAYYRGSGTVDEKLRVISAKLKGRKGELVLASFKFKKQTFFGGPSHRESQADYSSREVFYLGLLSEESLLLDLKTGKAGLPTGGMHVRYLTSGTQGFEISEGNVCDQQVFTDLIGLAEMVILGSYPPILQNKIKLVYGDEEVVGWILNQAALPLIKGEFLADFYRMARMLGKVVQNDWIIKAADDRKTLLLNQLELLVLDKKRLDIEIRRIPEGKTLGGKEQDAIFTLGSKIQGITEEIRGLGGEDDLKFKKLIKELEE